MRRTLSRVVPFAIAVLFAAPSASQAQTSVDWTGTTSAAWATAGNWSALPANDLVTNIANFNLATYGGNPVFAPNAGTTSIAGITIGSSNGAMTLSGTSLSIGTSGLTIANGAGILTISSGVVIGGTQSWINNSTTNAASITGAITYNNTLTFGGAGSFSVGNASSTGAGGATIDTATVSLTDAAGFGTGLLTIQNGGTLKNTATILIANAVTLNGSNIILAPNTNLNGTGVWTLAGGTNTIDHATGSNSSFMTNNQASAWNVTGNSTLNFQNTGGNLLNLATFSNLWTLGANLTIGGTLSPTISGGFALNGAARTLTSNTSGTLTISGPLSNNVAAGTALTLAGSGAMTIGALTASGANSTAIIVNSTTGGVYTFSGASTFAGGVTLTSGIAEVGVDTTGGPPFTAGPLGTGTLTLNGGTLRPGSGGNRSIANAVAFTGGNSTLASSTANTRTLTMTGNVTVSGSPTITFSNVNNNVFNTGTFTLNSDATFAGAGNYTISNGLDLASVSRQITVNTIGTTAVLRGAITNATGVTLTFAGTVSAGTGSNITVGDGTNPVISGTTGGIIVNGATVAFGSSGSTFSGGITATSGIARLGGATNTVAGSITSTAYGVDAITANGGTITANSNTARTIVNNLAITGDSTFGVIGDTVNTGSLTFNPTSVTGGTITLNGTRSLTVNVATTLTGTVVGSGSPSLAVRGISTLALNNQTATANSFGNVAIGESVATGSLGGTVTAVIQTSLGAGNYTINYGGTLQTITGSFSPTNNFTVNNGGTLNLIGLSTPTGALIYNSGARIGTTTGNTVLPSGVTLPSAGVLLFTTGNALGFASGNYPSLTGTMAFGGSLGAAFTLGTTTLSSAANSARTIAFNAINNGGAANFTGLALNANLTVAGTGSSGIGGLGIPQGAAGGLGTITNTGGITVAMAPIGLVSMTATTSSFGTLNINSGIFSVDGGNTPGVKAGGTITLNGGTLRNTNAANNNAGWTDSISVGANGGRIESFSTQNAQVNSWTGAITGSGPLTLRYGGSGTNTSSVVLAPTSSTGYYNGTITLETTNGRGRAQFNANSLANLAAGGVVVTAGTTFGVDALATLTANIGKFTLNTDSILALDNISGSAVDLSSSGINRNIRLGGVAVTVSGGATLTPFGSTYNFSPQGNFVVNTTNWLTGGNNLDLRTGAIASGAYNVAASSNFAFNNSQNYTGTTNVTGIVNNSLMGGTTTAPTLVLAGADFSAAGATTVAKGGKITITSAGGKLSGTSSLTISGGGSIQDGDNTGANITDRIKNTATLTLGGTDGLGTFTLGIAALGFTHAQTLKSLTVNLGDNAISTTGSGGTGTLTFSDAAGSVYTRAAGGTVNIITAAGFTTNFTNVPTTSVAGSGGAQILIGAFLSNAGFVSSAGSGSLVTYTVQNAAGSWSAGQNIDTSAAITGTTTGGGNVTVSINSLRAVNGGTITIGTTATDSLSIASGMILVASNAPTINGPGSLTSGNGQDLIINMTGSNFTIAAAITGGLPLTIAGTGSGNLHLQSSANAFTGINANGATRVLIENAGAWGNAGAINLTNGSVFGYNAGATSKTLGSGYTVNIAPTGASFINGGTGTLIVQGAVTVNGTLNIGTNNGTIVPDGTLDFQGNISGAGAVAVGFGNRARTLFSGSDNSGWTGGLISSSTSGSGTGTNNIFAFNANSLGLNAVNASPIVLTRAANLYFDTNAAGAVTMNQAIAYNSNSTISFWGKGSGLSATGSGGAGTAPLTWAGQILGSGGITFQGTATADNQVSEIVLTNTVSTSGTPTTYSFGTSTSAQNFVNGQGGMQLGVTGFTGITANTTTSRVEDGTGSASAVLNGALGFVRFSGANSFIPGAVGPGFVSAISKANSGNDGRFGYLLTAGSTYALPEGKSFLIGSLGTGNQVPGVLGAAGTGTANLDGGTKSATGSLLTGFNGGDVNIHANAVGSTQSLTLLARDSGTLLVLGNTSAVVFAPTYGDSGSTSSITLLTARTGATTINKTGAGTVEFKNVQFNNPGSTTVDAAKSGFTVNVNAGTLKYTQNDTGTSYAAVTVATGATLQGTGRIATSQLTVSGTLHPGNSPGTLTVGGTGTTTFSSGNFAVDLNGTTAGSGYGQLVVENGSSINLSGATLTAGLGYTPTAGDKLFIIKNDNASGGLSGTFTGLANNAQVFTAGQTGVSGLQGYVAYNSDQGSLSLSGGNDVAIYFANSPVPEPGTILGLSAAGMGLAGWIRRRRNAKA